MIKSKAPQPIGAMDSNKMQLVLFFEDPEASILGQVGIFNWYVWHMNIYNIYISKLPILNQDILGIRNSWAKRLSFRHATSNTPATHQPGTRPALMRQHARATQRDVAIGSNQRVASNLSQLTNDI